MNSKQFSELLASKRVESGVSLGVMAARLGVNSSTVKSVEDGIHNLHMKLVMDYLSCLNLRLVVSTVTIDESELQVFSFSSYQELVDWIISRWPWRFKRKSRIDASGIEYVKILDSHGKEIEFDKYFFLELIEKSQYELEVLNDEQIEGKQTAFRDQYNNNQKLIKRNTNITSTMLVIGIIGFFIVDIWITKSLPDELFHDIMGIGALATLNVPFGLFFPFIYVGILLLFVLYLLYRIIKWFSNG